jgi:UDP-N-acetylglucosamine diphosphorylase/glucosamine-1-phosphate N-acetyltransferase
VKLAVFESPDYDALYPLTHLRASFELRCGYLSLAERIAHLIPHDGIAYCLREQLVATTAQRISAPLNPWGELTGGDVLFANGCWLPERPIEPPAPGEVAACGGVIVYARPTREQLAGSSFGNTGQLDAWLRSLRPTRQISARLVSRPWHLIERNPEAMREDFVRLGASGVRGELSPQAAIVGSRDALYVAPTAQVQPMAVIDTTHGPVFLDEGVKVFPFSRIEGPAFIGRETQVLGANIREGCSIGPVCRVGGEVEESIIHGYSNKYHDGFLGHAYVGEWVNLGALTTNSDLKNDYSTVQVYVRGKLEDTGSTKVGCFIGDHTKTSIGTYLNTGTVAGVMCVLVGSGGVLPKKIPSFAWYLNERFFKGAGLKAGIETARKAMQRRGRELTQADIELLRHVHEETKAELAEAIKKSSR